LDHAEPVKSELYDPFLALIADQLTGTTRSQRRALLTVTATSFVVFWSGVMPESIPSSGITQRLDRKLMLGGLLGVDIYFLVTFFIYWLADFWTWERNLRRAVESLQKTDTGKISLRDAIDLALREVSLRISIAGRGSAGSQPEFPPCRDI
jgi:hypothetical protein